MKLSNDIKLKLDTIFNKTGLVIELIEKETQLEEQYLYQLKINFNYPYVSGGRGLAFESEFWKEIRIVLEQYKLTFMYSKLNNCFIPFKNEDIKTGMYIGGMDFHDSVTSNKKYVIVAMTNNKVLVFNDLGGTSWLMKEKFLIK